MNSVLRSFLRPIVAPILARRWLFERAKYRGRTILSAEEGNERVAQALHGSKALAAGKIGGVELAALLHYSRNKDANGKCEYWGDHAKWLNTNAGVYPINAEIFSRFCQVYGQTLSALDLLAVWFQPHENMIRLKLAPQAVPMALTSLEPFLNERPWSRGLAGKKVLVVTPFANTVISQYSRRREVWSRKPDVLPEFTLETLRCPLSAGLIHPSFSDWFSALDAMRNEMSRRAFDVAIIGAGAWGVPLASHARSIGRIGIHLGGPTQILFGIRGGRWDKHPVISRYINDAWVRPGEDDRPENFRLIENGCYW